MSDSKENEKTVDNAVDNSRREVLKLGALGLVSLLPGARALGLTPKTNPDPMHSEHEAHPKTKKNTYLFFTEAEANFIEAAVARLIPSDEKWGGAIEADVPNYLDKQLSGSWGAGERLYRSGPWKPGTPQQGYQLPFTPAELFRTALTALNREFTQKGKAFHQLSPEQQDEFLKDLETSTRDLDGIPAKLFFSTLLKSTNEGFFADPVYGGNRNMIAWKMIGFPGAAASYFELVDKHGIKLNRAPVSLAQDAGGHVHVNPNIPATIPGKATPLMTNSEK